MLKQYDEALLDDYVEDKDLITLRRIFFAPYNIAIKQQYLIDEDEIALTGVRMYGSPQQDFIAGDTITNTFAFIANMADLFDQGIPFVITQPSRLREIVNYIDDYLRLGVRTLNDHYLTRDLLEQRGEFKQFYLDLLKLEAFSKEIKLSLLRFEPATMPGRITFGQTVKRSWVRPRSSEETRRMVEVENFTIVGMLNKQNKEATRLFTPKSWR